MEAPGWIEQLFAKRSTHIKPGLENMQMALRWVEAGVHKNVLIAGTNGKGTAAAALWRLLSPHMRVGLFTSPHLTCFSERFEVSDTQIDLSDVQESLLKLQNLLPEEVYEQLSFFELSALIAVDIFKTQQCDVVLWEVGLGGRLDATNAMEPDVSVVTSIDLDHQEWLGDTVEKIAVEKLGVSRPSRPLVWGEENPDLDEVLAKQRNLIDFWLIKPKCYPLPKSVQEQPNHLQRGFQIAATVVETLGYQVVQDDYERAQPARFYRGRCQKVMWQGRVIWLDVCHNPAAARKFCQWLLQQTQSLPVFYSILDDKDQEGILQELAPISSVQRAFRSQSVRCTTKAASFTEQLLWVVEQDIREFVVCGSFQAVADALDALKSN